MRRAVTFVLSLAMTLLSMPFLPFGVAPASAEVTPVANPPWPNTCGIDVAMVIDRSNSIANGGSQYPTNMKNAAIGVVNALSGTPSRIGVWSFGSTVYNQTNPIDGSAGNATKFPYRTYTSVSSGTGVTDLTNTINSIPFQTSSNDGGTNWEDGFEVVAAPADPAKTVILYLTDGNPTLPTLPGNSTEGNDLPNGITQANIKKTAGIKVVGVAIGADISIPNIQSISGPNANDDYFATDFANLQAKLLEIATRLCSPSVTITKQVEQANGTYVNADGWQFQAQANSPVPSGTAYTWISPTGTPGSPVTASTHTDAFFNGSVLFQWEPNTNVDSVGTFTEQPTPTQSATYALDSVTCKRTNKTYPNGQTFTPSVSGQTFTINPVGPEDIVTCTVKNKLRRGNINIPKVTNTGTALPGAIFGLYTNSGATGSPTATCTTAAVTGICSFTSLVPGNFWVKEVSAPPGYVPSSTIIPVTVVADQTTTTSQVVNQAPGITVTKDANPTSLPEPGGSSAFTVSIHNDSPAGDSVTISTLTDNVYGNLHGKGNCSVPQVIASGATYTCTFNGAVSGAPGSSHTDTVTASGKDTFNNNVSDTDDATVTITNVPSSIQVLKSANPTSLPEPGGNATFNVSVQNTSSVDTVTISTLTDNVYGNLDGKGTCDVSPPIVLAPGATYSCAFTGAVSGNAGSVHTDTVTASGTDDDGTAVSDTDDATVSINDVPSSITVTKDANPTSLPEPGGNSTFSVSVHNDSAVDTVTISTLTDDVYGNLDGKGTCDVSPPIVLAPGATYSCAFTGAVSGNAGSTHTDTVTATGTDDDGQAVADSDDATVTITDVPSSIQVTKDANPTSLPEPGGNSTFNVSVQNTSSVDTVTINTLVDNVYGNLDGQGTCDVTPAVVLAPGATYSCAFTGAVTGNAGTVHTDTVTASGTDDDGQPVSDTDDATVTITDVPSSIQVTKDANPTSLPEPGGNATFNVSVQNTSSVDTVTISTLTDNVYGNLDGKGTCDVSPPIVLAPGATYSCAFTGAVSGNAGSVHTDTVTASGTDDDGTAVSDTDDATVSINDVPSSITVTKDANPTSLPEPGGNSTFSVSVHNDSAVDTVTISTLTDDVYGNLDGKGTCDVSPPIVLAPGATYSCAFTGAVSGNAGSTHTDTVTATGTDDDGQAVADSDDATVTITDVPSSIQVTKDANPTSLPEPGGNSTFNVSVQNTSSVDTVTINTLVDNVYGNLDGQGTCDVTPAVVLAPGATYSCAFTGAVTGNAGTVHTDTVTASGTDDDGQPVSDTDDATVTITDVPSSIQVTKDANPTSLPEPGGNATFNVSVQNTSSVDTVTINTLVDDVYGNLDGQGTCDVTPAVVLAPGATYSCAFTGAVSGNAGSTHTDTVTASGTDDDGQPVSDTDDATVTITNVPSSNGHQGRQPHVAARAGRQLNVLERPWSRNTSFGRSSPTSPVDRQRHHGNHGHEHARHQHPPWSWPRAPPTRARSPAP
ncbi:MAG: SpaA isopeptide-forming pilin-related protein [Acidimicrobiia bacterium]